MKTLKVPDPYLIREQSGGFESAGQRPESTERGLVPTQPSTVMIERELALNFDNPKNCVLQWLQAWPHFCLKFGLPVMVDFGKLKNHPTIVNRRKGFDWVIYEPRGISLDGVLSDLCRKQFPTKLDYRLEGFCSRRNGVISDAKSIDPPAKRTRLWLCQASNTPDRQFLGAKWSNLVERREVFMGPLQRATLEAIHFYVYKDHLDIKDRRAWTTRMLHAPVFKTNAKVSQDYIYRGLNATAFWNHSQFCLEADHFLHVGDDQGGPREVIEVDLAGYAL